MNDTKTSLERGRSKLVIVASDVSQKSQKEIKFFSSNKDINVVLEEYRNLYSILPKFAEKAFRNKNEVKQLNLKNLVLLM